MKRLFIDSTVCTGCRLCEAICSFVHTDGETLPSLARIRVHLNIPLGHFEPMVCRQCTNPMCIQACPEGALTQNKKTGAPVLDQQKCNLCFLCMDACPFNAIFFNEQERMVLLCDLCGGDPVCVKFCRTYPHNPHAALVYIEPKEWARIRRAKQVGEKKD